MPATPATGAVVRAEDIVVQFPGGKTPALAGVSFELEVGDGLVVTGDEGCGKSTLLRVLAGVVRPSYGTVSLFGGPAQASSARRRLGFGPETRPFPSGLRTRDVVDLVALVRGYPDTDVGAILERVGAAGVALRRVERLEVEDSRRLSLACALIGDPDLIVLDDPWEFPETIDEIAAARARGAAVVVASPDPGGFPALLGRTLTLDQGAGVA